jgi:hypothetical protein
VISILENYNFFLDNNMVTQYGLMDYWSLVIIK